MIMTSLEAHVDPAKQESLKQALKEQLMTRLPGLVEAVLTQNAEDPTLWRLMGFWETREAFESYRRSVAVLAGDLVFRAADAKPTFTMFDVVHRQKLT